MRGLILIYDYGRSSYFLVSFSIYFFIILMLHCESLSFPWLGLFQDFWPIVNNIIPLVSFSVHLSLVWRKAADFYVLTLSPATLLSMLIIRPKSFWWSTLCLFRAELCHGHVVAGWFLFPPLCICSLLLRHCSDWDPKHYMGRSGGNEHPVPDLMKCFEAVSMLRDIIAMCRVYRSSMLPPF